MIKKPIIIDNHFTMNNWYTYKSRLTNHRTIKKNKDNDSQKVSSSNI